MLGKELLFFAACVFTTQGSPVIGATALHGREC